MGWQLSANEAPSGHPPPATQLQAAWELLFQAGRMALLNTSTCIVAGRVRCMTLASRSQRHWLEGEVSRAFMLEHLTRARCDSVRILRHTGKVGRHHAATSTRFEVVSTVSIHDHDFLLNQHDLRSGLTTEYPQT